jgi:uncharacterized protein
MLAKLTPLELVRTIVSTLVEHPADVELHAIECGQATVFELRVNRNDTGRVIGKNGRTVRAVREILLALQGIHKRRYTLEIVNTCELAEKPVSRIATAE